MAHAHTIYDSDPHFTINPDTRELKYTSPEKLTIMQGDHNSEIITFDMPRFIDGHDMALCNLIQVHYINIDATFTSSYITGIYEVADKTLSKDENGNDMIVFSWPVSSNATSYIGQLNFAVRFCCVTNSVIEYSWHTAIYKQASISKSINNNEEFVDQYVDILTEWEDKLFGSYDTYEGRLKAVEEALENRNEPSETANALKSSASGKLIRVNDVSPIEHTVNAKVRGKNLLDVSRFTTTNQTSLPKVVEVGSDYLVLECPPKAYGHAPTVVKLATLCSGCEAGKTYILTADSPSQHQYLYLDGANTTWHFGTARVVTEAMLNSFVVLYGYNMEQESNTKECIISNIQIELGDTATEYEPYIDPAAVTVTRCGKNLIPLNTFVTTPTTTTVKVENSTLTLNGYLASHRVPAAGLVGKTLTLSFTSSRSGEKGGGFSIEFKDENNAKISGIYKQNELSLIHSFTVPDRTVDMVFFFYGSGSASETGTAVYKNVQVEAGNTTTSYEPYKGETYTPSEDGTCEITSASPTMTIYTDTDSVNIEIKYNQDTNVFADNMKTDVAELDRVTAEHTLLLGDVETALDNIDTALGDVETALDAIIAIQEELTAITFTFYAESLKAPDGMTWGEWIDSKYNTIGASVFDGNNVIVHDADTGDDLIICDEFSIDGTMITEDRVLTSDVIREGYEYKFSFYLGA